MQFVYHAILWLSDRLRPHLDQVAMSFAATILFLYGSQIHGVVKRQIQGLHFFFRLLLLVLLCAFGYGTLTVGFTVLCRRGLNMLDSIYLAPVIIGLFLLIGWLAERKKAV